MAKLSNQLPNNPNQVNKLQQKNVKFPTRNSIQIKNNNNNLYEA